MLIVQLGMDYEGFIRALGGHREVFENRLVKKCAVKGVGLQRVKLSGSGRQGCKSRKVEVLLPSIA
jgi:hypothetical protein